MVVILTIYNPNKENIFDIIIATPYLERITKGYFTENYTQRILILHIWSGAQKIQVKTEDEGGCGKLFEVITKNKDYN